MNKLYYSDGREVKSGDTVKYKDIQEGDILFNEEYYITVDEDGYSIESGLGCLGEIKSVERYELVNRWETSYLEHLIAETNRLLKHHEQSVEFEFHLRSTIKSLELVRSLIK